MEYMRMRKKDMVDHPEHYTKSSIEAIDIIKSVTGKGFQYVLDGNILKYLIRYRHKENPLQDLKKARWYLNTLIYLFEKK